MAAKDWKRYQPQSLPDAMEACLDCARDKHNLSVDQIADLMSLPNKWNLYKWVENGNMPLIRLRAFEAACQCNFVSRWLAHSSGRLLIDIPTGRAAKATDINELQALLTAAMTELINFAARKAAASTTLAAIRTAMEGLAWHHGNVAKNDQPEFDFEGK